MRKCTLCKAQTRGEVLVDLDGEPTFAPCCWRCYNDRVYHPIYSPDLLQVDIAAALGKKAT